MNKFYLLIDEAIMDDILNDRIPTVVQYHQITAEALSRHARLVLDIQGELFEAFLGNQNGLSTMGG